VRGTEIDAAGRDVVPGDEDVPVGAGGGAHIGGQLVSERLVVEVAHDIRHGDRHRFGVPGQIGQFGAPVGRQGHHRHDAGAQAGEREDHELPAVAQLYDDPVARRDAQLQQSYGGGVGPCGEFRVGEADAGAVERDGVHECRGVRHPICDLLEQGAQRHPRPVPVGDVAGHRLVRPGDGVLSCRGGHRRPPS
jgi:hypothetical protein